MRWRLVRWRLVRWRLVRWRLVRWRLVPASSLILLLACTRAALVLPLFDQKKSCSQTSRAAAQPLPAADGEETELRFAGVGASRAEAAAVASTMRRLADNSTSALPRASAEWLARTTPTDVLRYVRAVSGADGDSSRAAEAAWARLGSTAAWRHDAQVDEVANDPAYELDAFFERRGASAAQPEAEWLEGRDRLGRPAAIFHSGRHVPGAYPTSEWRRLVLHTGEKALREFRIGEGPGGQLSLVVDRSSSSLSSQDPMLMLALLPECLDHYPDLLGSVYIAPATPLFQTLWRVVRVFISERTASKVVLLSGADWREQLREAVGPELVLPPHLRPGG